MYHDPSTVGLGGCCEKLGQPRRMITCNVLVNGELKLITMDADKWDRTLAGLKRKMLIKRRIRIALRVIGAIGIVTAIVLVLT